MKTCTRCHTEKPLDEFALHPHTLSGRQSWCKQCHTEFTRQRRAQAGNPVNQREQANSRARGRAMEALVRLHPEEFESLLDRERAILGLSVERWRRSAS